MTQMVADSSSLILLAKCSLLEIVCGLFEVFVPTTVVAEVASEDLIRSSRCRPDFRTDFKGSLNSSKRRKRWISSAPIASQEGKRSDRIGDKAKWSIACDR